MYDMKKQKDELNFLIKQNLENLLDSHLKYGGVYLAVLDMMDTDGCYSLEVELDEGNISFTCSVSEDEVEALTEYLDSKLRENGIGVFRNYSDFESALDKSNG